TAPFITAGNYNSTTGTLGAAWTGLQALTNGSFFTTTVNVAPLAGRTAWFSFHFATDITVTQEGYYLDDVNLSADAPGACTPGSSPPGPAVQYSVTLPTATFSGTSTPVTIRALDAVDQVATGYNGNANLSSTDPGATLSPVTFTAGVANTNVTFATAGLQTLTATDSVTPTLTGSAQTTVSAGPGKLSFTTQPTNATAGVNIAPAIRVSVLDANNALVTTATNPITLAIGTNPSGGTLRGTVTVNAVAGVATFSSVNIREAGIGYTLVATSPTLTNGTSNTFNIIPDVPASLAFSQQPSNAVAGASIAPAVRVRINDQYGNQTASTANVTVAIANNAGGGTLSGAATVAAVAGQATFGNLSIDKVGAGYTLSAASGTFTGATSTGFDITPAAPVRVAFDVQPSNIAAGNLFSPSVRVSIRDQFNNVATQSNADISLVLGGGAVGATLLGTTTVTAAAGVATFPDISVDKAGNVYTLTAGSSGLATATSVSFNVTAGAAASLAYVTQPPASRQAGQTFGASVAILDQFGNRTNSTAAVALAISNNPGSGTLSGTSTVNAVNGLATFAGLSIDKVGTGYTLDATSGALPAVTSNPFNITPAAAAALAFAQQPSSAVAGVNISPAITVQVTDAFGNLVPTSTASVSLAIGINPGGDTLHGTTTATASGGTATFGAVNIQKVGTGYTLVASATGLTPATSSAFDISAAAAASLVFTSQPTTTVAGAIIAPPVSLEVRDGFGNVLTGFSGPVTASLVNAGSATLAGTTTVNAVAGAASFSDLSVAKAGTGYRLAASGSGLNATSSAFDIVPGPAAALAFTTQPVSGPANANFTAAVAVSDALGNLVTGATNSITVAMGNNPGGGTLSGTLTAAASGGVASFGTLSIDKAGLGYTLVASSTGLTSATSAAFDIGAGPAVGLEFVVQPSNAVAGVAISPAIGVRAVDASGNTASTGAITLAIANNAGGGTLSGTTTVTPVAGLATFNDISINKAGTGYTLSATSGALSATSASFNIANAAAGALVFTTQPSNAASGATIAPAVVVTAVDAFGNTDPSFTGSVSLTLGGGAGGATLAGTASVSAAAGVATFSDLSIAKAGTGYALTAAATGLTSATSSAFNITSGAATHLVIVGLAAGVQITVETSFSIEARDANDNVATGYAGTVHVTSDDARAVLPADQTLAAGVVSNVKITFRTAGTHTVTATDTTTASITGTASTNVTAFAAPAVTLDGASDGDTVDGAVHLTATGSAASGTTLTRLEIFVDGTSLANSATSPLPADWDTKDLANGSTHVLTATATDATGNTATTAPINVTVQHKGCGCSEMGGLDVGALAALGVVIRALALRRRRAGK
ncbi:MAG TPA: Ig-like domain-containing protein, partial [Myxococcaceae bacterium]|nr:Ig-like domain-containing protein [Myxococcaceae bacterium]